MTQAGTVIAVVDDDAAVRKGLKRLLRSAGYETLTYRSGADFLQSTGSRAHDCAIVDIQMDAMDGFEVLHRLRSLANDVPVILITAYESAGDGPRGLRSGAAGFLRKPFNDNELIDMIELALRRANP